MGEEEKKPEEKKAEEQPKAEEPKEEAKPKAAEEPKKEGDNGGGGEGDKNEGADGEAKSGVAAEPPPPSPEEIEMRVFMHCEGCARKVKRCLKGFDGVEDVQTDCKSHKVVVKGKKAAEDPLKVVERVQKKTGRKVELLTPLPRPKPEKKEEEKEEEKPKSEEKEEPVVIAVVLKVHMHCEACALEIKKRILKMKGVQAAEPELKSSQVVVKGVFDPAKLVEYVYKRTGKHAVVVKQEPAEKPPQSEAKLDENADKKPESDPKDSAADKDKKEDGAASPAADDKDKKEDGAAAAAPEDAKVVEVRKNEFLHYYPRYPVEYAYPPQIFSDENPNACAVM